MTALMRGQAVVLPGGVFGTVVDFPTEDRVRVAWVGGIASIYYVDEVRTRAQQLHHMHHLTARIAADLGDLALMDAVESLAALVERAGQQLDAADAVRGLSVSGGVA